MSYYYYFVSTLPALQFSQVPVMGYGEFIERAGRFLSSGDAAALSQASLQVPADGKTPLPATAVSLLAHYYRWERALRNELVRLRAQRLHKSADQYLKPGDVEWDALRVAQAAFASDNPLEGEMLIERERWTLIDRLATNHFFDMDYLAAYALKLQSLARRHRFEPATGEEGYKTVYRSVLDSADYRNQSGDTL